MNFDNDLMLFFRTIYEDSADIDECSAKVKSAVADVADKLDIVRAELAVKMPATKLCEMVQICSWCFMTERRTWKTSLLRQVFLCLKAAL